jgi:OmpA family
MEAAFDAEQRQFQGLVNGLRNSDKNIVVEGYALPNDRDKQTASLERANKVRDQLLRSGIDGTKISAIGKGEQQGKNGGVRILEVPAVPQSMNATTQGGKDASKPEAPVSGDPIGTSHFESGSTMSVLKGSSAMVSIYKGDTGGDVVYLYDAESQRGNAQYPFKAVRFKNPTDSQLEQGPVTVFGDGRFIGEGLAEPIPARGTAFVPYALDRQLVVERKDGEKDEIARIITVQRGVFSTEVKHSKKRTLTIFNRSNDASAVYIRHTLTPGYAFTSNVPKLDEKLGGAQLFKIDVPAHGKVDAVIEEATPVYRTTDIRTTDGLEMIRVFASQAALDAGLKTQVNELIKLHLEMATLTQRIQTVREQQGEYKARMDELHAQIFTLKAVKTAGPMMNSLEKKMMEMSDRVSKATIEIVGLEEKLMVAKIKFQDGVAELSTEKTQSASK